MYSNVHLTKYNQPYGSVSFLISKYPFSSEQSTCLVWNLVFRCSPSVSVLRQLIPFSTSTSCFLNITFKFNLRIFITFSLLTYFSRISFSFLFRNFVRNSHTTVIYILSHWVLTPGDIVWNCTFRYYMTKIKKIQGQGGGQKSQNAHVEKIFRLLKVSKTFLFLFFWLLGLLCGEGRHLAKQLRDICVYKVWWKFHYITIEVRLREREVLRSCWKCHAFSNLHIIVNNFVTVRA
jgi:hypothetical protein